MTGPPDPGIVGFDHVQLAAPPAAQDAMRAFYTGVLGMTEIPKPASLAVNGGAWFQAGTCQLHVGLEEGHRPSLKSHPGLVVRDLPAYAARIEAAGGTVTWDDRLPGRRRCYAEDPAGNRLEFLEAQD